MNRRGRLATIRMMAVAARLAGETRAWGAAPVVTIAHLPAGAAVPDAFVDPAGRVHVVYGKDHDIWYAVSADAGISWTSPIRVNDVAGAADEPGLFRGPGLALGTSGRVHVVWAPRLAGRDEGFRYAHHDPDTRGFGDSVALSEPAAGGTDPVDGLSIAADGQGRVTASWVRPGALLVARSTDDGASFAPAERVPPADPVLTCETRGVFLPDGFFLLLYRDIAGVARRESVMAWTRTGSPVRRMLSVQPWPVDACPTTGGWISPAGDGAVAAWETGETVFWTRVDGAGRPFPAGEIRTDALDGRWPVILANTAGAVVVAWKQGATLCWQTFDRDGGRLGAIKSAPSRSPDRAAGVVLTDGSFLLIDSAP